MDKELLHKYFNNCYTEEELNHILTWIKKSANTSEGKALLYKMWEELPEEDQNLKTNFDLLLDRIHHQVNLDQSATLLRTLEQNPLKYPRKQYFMRIIRNAAAILMLPFLGFGLYMSSKYYSSKQDPVLVNQAYNEVFSSVDAITKVTLPDGSNVWLNHSSTLRYPATFREKCRTVELDGEGYFEVAHDSTMPFIVNTGEIEIVALGTTFNILAYPDEGKIETSLINGSVKLQRVEEDGSVIQLLKMEPTDLVVYNKINKKILTRNISDDRYFSWKSGKLVFNKEPMGEVIKKLGRWFNVDIQVQDPKLLDLTFTGTLINETLPQVLELMALITPIRYSISTRHELSTGTFSKRLVILSSGN